MTKIETELLHKGYRYIAGVDEAGRGPLAGPVVAAAVILPYDQEIKNIKDSKRLNPNKRMEAYEAILGVGMVGIGMATATEIDQVNILQATFMAMHRAIRQLSCETSVDYCVIDGNKELPGLEIKQEALVRGDALCYSVAAASIVAKVYRDNLMEKLQHQYPQYGFSKHKGYPTKQHLAALAKYGPTPVHRYSFAHVNRSQNL